LLQKNPDLSVSYYRRVTAKAKRSNSVKQAEQTCWYGTIFDKCASVRTASYSCPQTDRLKSCIAIIWTWTE